MLRKKQAGLLNNLMKKNYQYLLMDLDGTVTDPMEGITHSVQHALSAFGIEVRDLRELCPFIGPPLKNSFMEFYHFTEEQAEQAIGKYREYFSGKGIFENKIYEGMEDFLAEQVRQGKQLSLATSKPEPFARQILEYFGIDSYFTFIGGSTLDGTRSEKPDVVRYVLESQHITDYASAVMIGDRKFDIEGAKANGIDSIGVLYGYGSQTELTQAGANHLVTNLNELASLL